MIKILIGVAAFALATTSQVSLAGTSQVSYSSDSNYTTLAAKGNHSKCKKGYRHVPGSKTGTFRKTKTGCLGW